MSHPNDPLHRSATSTSFRRELDVLVRWTVRDFRARYLQTSISAAWAFVQPLAQVAVYVLIFGVILQQSDDKVPFVTYLLAGMIIFRPVASALGFSSCLVDNVSVMSHSKFPREVIPIAQMAGASFELLVTVPMLFVIGTIQGVTFGRTLVAAPLILASIWIFATGLCIATSTAQVFVRDSQFTLPIVTQVLFFASPVTYPDGQVPSWLDWLSVVNPISVHLEAFRDVALYQTWPRWGLLGIHMAISVALLAASVLHLRSIQHRIIDLA